MNVFPCSLVARVLQTYVSRASSLDHQDVLLAVARELGLAVFQVEAVLHVLEPDRA